MLFNQLFFCNSSFSTSHHVFNKKSDTSAKQTEKLLERKKKSAYSDKYPRRFFSIENFDCFSSELDQVLESHEPLWNKNGQFHCGVHTHTCIYIQNKNHGKFREIKHNFCVQHGVLLDYLSLFSSSLSHTVLIFILQLLCSSHTN